ncbi:MAG: outer membrane beta-barrel protein [Proteobacteria bacterium]|nr:outer membrane beta-barrel protein [Pseudomonadota bacterium]
MNKWRMALLISTALMATGAQAQWLANWVLGLSGSYNWIDADENGDDQKAGFLISNFAMTEFDLGEQSNNVWGWGVLGGYQARCNGWLLGVEFAADWLDSDNDDNGFAFTSVSPFNRSWIGNVNFERDYILALTGRMGYEAYPYLMPYIRAGVETSRDKVNFIVFTPSTNGGVPFLTASGDSHCQSWRFIGGIGAEVPIPIFAGVTFRAEWNFHSNGKSVDATALANDGATLISVSGKQETNTAKISLVYNLPA